MSNRLVKGEVFSVIGGDLFSYWQHMTFLKSYLKSIPPAESGVHADNRNHVKEVSYLSYNSLEGYHSSCFKNLHVKKKLHVKMLVFLHASICYILEGLCNFVRFT